MGIDDPIHLPHAVIAVAALESGMVSGAASIAIRIDLPDGQVVIAETSLAAWIAATCAIRGAFPAEFYDTPLASPLLDDEF
jgi:hypothetical protein